MVNALPTVSSNAILQRENGSASNPMRFLLQDMRSAVSRLCMVLHFQFASFPIRDLVKTTLTAISKTYTRLWPSFAVTQGLTARDLVRRGCLNYSLSLYLSLLSPGTVKHRWI
ncbi:hypothetical protein RRG08_036763 [Elysia crispata]|uniref:Uncharacterized protein n=1 Tax=Elysia crispata TaxID=231223 RepID=A0AAE1CV59_9GAST|nr:hypothetical protein RRG08_036763 [Elysia crispata]